MESADLAATMEPADLIFWSLQVPKGKKVTRTLNASADTYEILHITQIALGEDPAPGRHTLRIHHQEGTTVLGTLERGRCEQFQCDVLASYDVTFSHTGKSTVHLSGYFSLNTIPASDAEELAALEPQAKASKLSSKKLWELQKDMIEGGSDGAGGNEEDDEDESDDEDWVEADDDSDVADEDGDEDDEDDDDDDEEDDDDDADEDQDDIRADGDVAIGQADAGATSDDEDEGEEEDDADVDDDEDDDEDDEDEEEHDDASSDGYDEEDGEAVGLATTSNQGKRVAQTPPATGTTAKRQRTEVEAPATAPAKMPAGAARAYAGALRQYLSAHGPTNLSALGGKVKKPKEVPKMKQFLLDNADLFDFDGKTLTVTLKK